MAIRIVSVPSENAITGQDRLKRWNALGPQWGPRGFIASVKNSSRDVSVTWIRRISQRFDYNRTGAAGRSSRSSALATLFVWTALIAAERGFMPLDHSFFEECLKKARNGDDFARNRLFEACRSCVAIAARVHLHRRLQSKFDPSDLVQQSLLDAHCGFEDFQGGSPAEWLAWLKQIVKHNAMDADKRFRQADRRDLRREFPLQFFDSTGTKAEVPLVDPGPSPSQFASKGERELQLAAAIEALPDDYRQVILLRNLERLPFDRVAERMNRTRGACQMLWMRAVEQLRLQLNGEAFP